ncbi:hypothetical protein GCM10007916_03010 [Psychromonas marina]|uniref:Uncharacterized protein n=1 Tax=Psychromonas marina TaxID=88364 RepID=A0ABQ6DVW6_9GAMM|nr:hypothetical protein [Psychromonas marina]GLS89234.1 hypothetical protein GCM10007916_03010 [Psychromonas marina]
MFRIVAIFITLFLSTSVFSDVVENNLSVPQAKSIELMSDNQNLNMAISDSYVLETELIETKDSSLQPVSDQQGELIDFITPLRANLLNYKQFQSPDYIFVYALLTAQLDIFENNENTLAETPPAWFMSFSGNSSRLSGWKESNSLYTAKNTYHLS